jgi:hemerythrin superfamily protein
MKKPAKKPAKRATKARTKTAAQKLGSALASTASFAAGVARETEGMIRDLASSVTMNQHQGPAPRATDLLVHQHRRLEALFDHIESSKKHLEAPLRELADDLSAHIAIEERLFYPAVRKLKPDLILEGLEEHAMGRFALERLLGTKASDASLQARFKALKELMTNHHHEEEHELFTVVRRAMPSPALEKLGAAMKKLFDAEVKRGHETVLSTFDDHLRKPVHGKSAKRRKLPTKK